MKEGLSYLKVVLFFSVGGKILYKLQDNHTAHPNPVELTGNSL